MNKLFVGLLIVAAGAGIFFLLRKKKPVSEITELKKELIIGKWMPDTAQKKQDTLITQFRYDFMKDGNVLRSLNDSAKADTSHYEWSKNNELIWSAKPADSTADAFVVLKLNNDSLQLQHKDSSTVLFLKVK